MKSKCNKYHVAGVSLCLAVCGTGRYAVPNIQTLDHGWPGCAGWRRHFSIFDGKIETNTPESER